MKLRTEMHGSDCFFKDGPKDTQHDAMAAHALLQAMEEQLSTHFSVVSDPAKKALRDASKRAAEILAGWMGDRG